MTLVMEKDIPTQEQLEVLHRVKDRVMEEFQRERDQIPKGQRGEESEPLRALVHGIPGTGKSKLISFLRSFFEDALGWCHGEQ